MLAEPPGCGKTWIALAAARDHGVAAVVIGPAILRTQWHRVAAQADVGIEYHSIERLSRGTLPRTDPTFVVIDEAHRFRDLGTRRTRTVGPWLVGRRVLMLTATPVINRRADLLALLRLVLPDDALALDGVPSLERLAERNRPPAALRRLVIRSPDRGAVIPVRTTTMPVSRTERERAAAVISIVEGMTLGSTAGVRRLVAGVLLDAAASSDAAWHAALRRYRALLLQARDAGGASRAMLRQFAGTSLDQTVMWSLLGDTGHPGAPPAEDLPLVETALSRVHGDAALFTAIEVATRDDRPTVCFCRHLATAIALGRHLGEHAAWVTGNGAGIGPHRLARDQVLAAFGPHRSAWVARKRVPSVLVTTEVLSEGLDLQGASRVVHVDLPWHPARHAQRTGRLARAGQLAPDVEEVVRPIPPAIERRLRLLEGFRRKRRWVDAWLTALEQPGAPAPVAPRATWCATVPGCREGTTALVHLAAATRSGTLALTLRRRRWEPQPDLPALPRRLAIRAPAPPDLRRWRHLARRAGWQALLVARAPHVPNGRLVSDLLLAARRHRERRDAERLRIIDAFLARLGQPLALGEAWHLEAALAAGTPASRPRSPAAGIEPGIVRIAWIVLVHFVPGGAPLR
jgi:hypothetical protein